VDLHPDDKEKTAFSTGEGLWQFTVMCFGPCNAPTTFQRLMETVLKGLTNGPCLMYLDAFMVSHTFQDIYSTCGMWSNGSEMPAQSSIHRSVNSFRRKYLGHIVSPEAITDPENLKAVREYPIPKNKHEIRSFLDLCSYYRRLNSGFANVSKLLTKLTEKEQAFQSTP
jgi:hypothetical protein